MSIHLRYFLNSFILISLCVLTFSCKHKDGEATTAPPVKVKIRTITPIPSLESRTYSGTVESDESTTVSFSVAGTISDLYVNEGQKVSKGQLLGKLRNGEYLNAYNITLAQLTEAQDGYERLKKLHEANALPDVKWVEIQQKLKQAENMAEMAKRTLDDANLYSPVSGTVTKKYADPGQTVVPVEPVYEILSTSALTINIPVSENEIADFENGQAAKVLINALGKEEIEGKVSQKAVTADPLTRSYTVKVTIPNEGGKILPGMLGSVKFENTTTNSNDSVLRIILPSQVVMLNDDNRRFVWVVSDSTAQRRFVTADMLEDEGVVITSGLKSGDKVIVEGIQKVGTGTKVSY